MTHAKNLQSEAIDEKTEKILADFSRSYTFDRRLFNADVRVNLAYCDALFHAGILTRLESERIKNGLQTILKRADFYQDYFNEPSATSIHSFIETRLVQLIGEAAEKINVGRSRYDQSLTAFRLWLREEIEEISTCVRDLQTALIGAAQRQREAVLPAYANSQKAQPVLWAHWCLAYFEMLARDRERLDEVWRRVNVLPLGAADLAGTFIEIDREEVAAALGFEGISANSLDTASDADFAVESNGACSILMIHLSRLAEDLILYNSDEFGFFDSGSEPLSGFPIVSAAKKSLDALELVRGKAGKIFGYQSALLSLTKSLPLGVHKDLQEVKETIFDAVDAVKSCLRVVRVILETWRVNEVKTLEAASRSYLNAAELINYLVQKDVSVKLAQSAVGEIVTYAGAQKKKLDELTLNEFQKFSENIGDDVFRALSLEQALASKNQIGGTSPERVFEALEQARENLEIENADDLTKTRKN